MSTQPSAIPASNNGTRGGMAVFVGLLVIGFFIAWGLKNKYAPELAQTQDLVLGLLYFLEASGGEFPASEEQFAASPFVERLPDGAIRVKRPTGTNYRTPNRIAIRELKQFQIAWGTDLSTIDVTDRGKTVHKTTSEPLTLVSWPSSPPSGPSYTILLLQEAARIRAASGRAATDQTSTQPAVGQGGTHRGAPGGAQGSGNAAVP